MDSYLIPANAKRGMLIFGRFKPIDLVIGGIGLAISTILLIIKVNPSFTWIIISLIPGFIAITLIIPMPNYHNILTAITSAISFFVNRRIYIWKGWCIYDASKYEE